MDQTNIVIYNVNPLNIPKIEIETNEGKQYQANLSYFQAVSCFPKNQTEWKDVSITANGFNLTWGTRFEVHVNQIIDSANSVEELKLQA